MPAVDSKVLRIDPAEAAVQSVSVVIPCRNERSFIESCLNGLLAQKGVPSGYEILVADGESDDGTVEIVRRIAVANPAVRLIENPRGIVSTGLNAAIREARGEVIIRIDAHTEYADDYVANCLKALVRTGAENVGGPARTRSSGFFQAANAAAFHSPFAVGGARFHDSGYEGFVDTVPYGCWWKSYLISIGMFDETFVRNQDDELNLRIVRGGGKIWQSSLIRSWYFPRSTARGLFAQYFQYGYWKVMVLRKHKIPASVRHLVPILSLAIAAGLVLFAPVSNIAAYALVGCAGAYALASSIASVFACASSETWRILPLMPYVFFLYHAGYALGFASALVDLVRGHAGMRATVHDITR